MFALNRGVVLIFLILGIFSISQVFGVCCGGSYDLEKIKKRCHVTDDRFANDLCPDCELKTPYCGMFYSDSQVSSECCGGDMYDLQKIMKKCHIKTIVKH
ncbi:hypothetical protein BLOT_008705 [Blomia tropicalis]|nr:hypothetical protein BLOT_008705 [Blomia tropicalis]